MISVEDFALIELSLDRAKRIAPPKFIEAYEWFEEAAEKGEGPLPYGPNSPSNIRITLASQRGIHKPADYKYALSVTSAATKQYEDKLHGYEQGDGTWILRYKQQAENKQGTHKSYNQALFNCFKDGLPVGVFVKNPRTQQYKRLGLAFIEAYDSRSKEFVLHGPVTSKQDPDMWSAIPHNELPKQANGQPIDYDGILKDERTFQAMMTVKRKRQDSFRRNVLRAYGYRCAFTKFEIEKALEAAHISSYRGPQSQRVFNGLSLRADIHLLFDDHQLSVDPDSYKIKLNQALLNSSYSELQNQKIILPESSSEAPDEMLLSTHFGIFRDVNKI